MAERQKLHALWNRLAIILGVAEKQIADTDPLLK